jgi:hypothetical protein
MPAGPSLVAQWDELMLSAIRQSDAKPTETTYHLHLTTAAIYDAWAAFDSHAFGHYSDIVRPEVEHSMANKDIAISFAAYRILTELFPDHQASFEAFMNDLGLDPGNTAVDPTTAAGVGNLAALNVMAARAQDGSNYQNAYADTTGYTPRNAADPAAANAPGGADFDPNSWQPLRVPTGTIVNGDGVPIVDPSDPSSYADQVALTPHWGGVDSFALLSGDQFRPPAPPQLGDFAPYVDGLGNVTTGDQAYRDQTAEVVAYSASLDNRGKVIAEYWADGPRTESPPGHWNQIAQDIALREGHGTDEDAKLFFAVNAALLDAGIATWEAKYHYDFVRPQSAIRNLYYGEGMYSWAGPNQGTQMILGHEWQPYQATTFVTPPFPEFVSGHSTFSMAAARTIASFVGSDSFYDGVSYSNYDLDPMPGVDLIGQYITDELYFEQFEGNEPVVLQWATLTEAAEEAGLSRLYGGIHVMDGNLRGLDLGDNIATQSEIRWAALFTRAGNDNIRADAEGGLVVAGSGDDTVTGRAGEDFIEGGAGDDRLRGRGGEDTLLGGLGEDTLRGNANADLLEGGADADVICGNQGDDVLLGGAGDDTLRGNSGEDALEGGDGDDSLFGGSGGDWLAGGTGNDDLYGRRGNDTMAGGDGRDHLTGGRGADQFVIEAGDTETDRILDFNPNVDLLLLIGFDPNVDLQVADRRGETIVYGDSTRLVILDDIAAEDLVLGDNLIFSDTAL